MSPGDAPEFRPADKEAHSCRQGECTNRPVVNKHDPMGLSAAQPGLPVVSDVDTSMSSVNRVIVREDDCVRLRPTDREPLGDVNLLEMASVATVPQGAGPRNERSSIDQEGLRPWLTSVKVQSSASIVVRTSEMPG